MEKIKTVKIIKISVFSVLCALEAFFVYSLIGYLTVWFSQPRFVAVTGSLTTASLGFMIQFIIFAIFFLLVLAALIVLGIKFFKKSGKKS